MASRYKHDVVLFNKLKELSNEFYEEFKKVKLFPDENRKK